MTRVGKYRDPSAPDGWSKLYVSAAALATWQAAGRPSTALKNISPAFEPSFNIADYPDRSIACGNDVMAFPQPEADALVAAGLATYA